MEKSEQKIAAPIFEIDAQEMNALADEFVRNRELDKDQEVNYPPPKGGELLVLPSLPSLA